MNARHHPDLAWLVDYAAGSLTAGFRTVVAGHLYACAECRAQLRVAEILATRLVDESPALASKVTPAAIRARSGSTAGEAPPARAPERADSGLSGLISGALAFDWNALDWRNGVPGLRIARLQEQEAEHIWLLHAGPGVSLPEHTHIGAELTLVLHGAYRSGADEYAAGDVDEGSESARHRPVVTTHGDCSALLVFEGRLRYTGVMGIAQRLLKF